MHIKLSIALKHNQILKMSQEYLSSTVTFNLTQIGCLCTIFNNLPYFKEFFLAENNCEIAFYGYSAAKLNQIWRYHFR